MNQQQQHVTTAIVLARINYGEADRIITFITPEAGKLRLMAKGVRRIKSKLAGGIELFSVSQITYIRGRGEIGTLVSTRLQNYYSQIATDIDRTMLGYDIIKQLSKATEDEPEADYFYLLEQVFVALNTKHIDANLIQYWFSANVLRLAGHTPNLTHDVTGVKLEADQTYEFSFDDSSFKARQDGPYKADDIKFLRVVFGGNSLQVISQIEGAAERTNKTRELVQLMSRQHGR